MTTLLDFSKALWNFNAADLRSIEVVAQIMDRGSLEDWRELARRAVDDPALRKRMRHVAEEVPISMPWFWMSWLRSVGEEIPADLEPPSYADCGT